MASLYTVLATLEAAISAATAMLVSTASDTAGKPIKVLTGIGWPSSQALENNVRRPAAPQTLVTIYDRGMASDATRWKPIELLRQVTPAGITAEIQSPTILPHQSTTITLGGTVVAGDAVSALLAPAINGTTAQVAIASATDTPATMATQLAALINADPDTSALVSASTSGGTVTLASNQAEALVSLQVYTGNGASRTTEIARRNRPIQIIVWTRTQNDRITIGDAIENVLARAQADFGLTFPDTTMGRLLFHGDIQHDDATLGDTYRRDFMLTIDYPITTTDALYAVLAPISRNLIF